MDLKAWAEAYLRHRDLFRREIALLKPTSDGFMIEKKDGSVTRCLIIERLDPLPPALDNTLLVTRNTKENVLVLRDWKRLVQEEGLVIVFANAAKNEKWVLSPGSHARIADPASLKTGLLAMHQAVPEG